MGMKGQSSIEFLVTYGWAIMALFIVLGILLFSGIFNIENYKEEQCFLGPNLACFGEVVKVSDSEIKMAINITNKYPYKIKLEQIKITNTLTKEEKSLGIYKELDPGESSIIKIGFTEPRVDAQKVKQFALLLKLYICSKDINEQCLAKPESEVITKGMLVSKMISP